MIGGRLRAFRRMSRKPPGTHDRRTAQRGCRYHHFRVPAGKPFGGSMGQRDMMLKGSLSRALVREAT